MKTVTTFIGLWIAACFPAAILVNLADHPWLPMIAIIGFITACGIIKYNMDH